MKSFQKKKFIADMHKAPFRNLLNLLQKCERGVNDLYVIIACQML